MKTVDDFKQAALLRNITRWDTHTCGFCGEFVGYVIWDADSIFFDSSCGCSYGEPLTLRPSSWDAIADYYNRNIENTVFIEGANKLWGFEG